MCLPPSSWIGRYQFRSVLCRKCLDVSSHISFGHFGKMCVDFVQVDMVTRMRIVSVSFSFGYTYPPYFRFLYRGWVRDVLKYFSNQKKRNVF